LLAALVPAAIPAGPAEPARAQSPRSNTRGRLVAAPSAALAARLRPLLDAPPFDRSLWGIAVLDPAGRLVFERNGDRLFVTASAAKVVVAATAAALLPENYRFRTSVYAAGGVVDGEVRGDLVLYGRGDPALSGRYHASPLGAFEELADTLRARGITRIAGDVVADASWFDSLTVHPSWEAYDLMYWFAAPVTAIAFNDNAVDVSVTPSYVGGPPLISFAPDLGAVRFRNFAVTAPAGARNTFDFYRHPGTNDIWAAGELPVDGRPYSDNVAVADGPLWAATAFVRALHNRGITVSGAPRRTFDSTAYAAARARGAVAEHESAPLDDLLKPILAVSHNWYAEMLLRTLGREVGGGAGGTWEDGVAVERAFLRDSFGIDTTQFHLVDGSGLSHHNLMTPRAFVTLLRNVRQHPRSARFLDALAVPGQAGTLRTRFRFAAPAGRVRAKTGSIGNTNSLVGYLENGDGGYWTYAILLNNHVLPNRDVLRRIDEIVAAITR
jgi:D-alanyl-D-alanine carboxypeptidase/D-alanyl-D-alanine-endopeptidase (penicillin-binding protein 4)